MLSSERSSLPAVGLVGTGFFGTDDRSELNIGVETPPGSNLDYTRIKAEEAARIGLVEETAIDWDGAVDIDLDVPGAGTGNAEVDIAIEAMEQAEGAPPTHGPQLMQHLQTGIAYRMHLEGRWQRVRLSWTSPGRAFFVFTHGKAHEKTVSMTSRMLRRLCDTERFRAFEQAELIERATSRARKQLAQLSAAARPAMAHRH